MVRKNSIDHLESKITILSLLKNYYDNEVFYSLIGEIYNSDIAVSVAAINASASLGNKIAIPHLYEVFEKEKAGTDCGGNQGPGRDKSAFRHYPVFRGKDYKFSYHLYPGYLLFLFP